jgi:hypothetical protein
MKKLLIGSVLLMTLQFGTKNAFAGIETGGGGAIVIAQFVTTGRVALEILSQGDPSINLEKIYMEIKNTKVIAVDSVCKLDVSNGRWICKDAEYDSPSNTISFNYINWQKFSCIEKLTLASHEYLRAAGLESDDYIYSGRFLTGNLAQCSSVGGSSQQQFKCDQTVVEIDYKIREVCRHLK